MFHDVFGHIPLLTDEYYCDFLVGLSEIVLPFIDNPTIVHLMSRIYWFTIEFGLKLEEGKRKIYGAGIISSSGETEYCMSHVPTLYSYEVAKLFATPYYKDHIQDKYFVVQSFEELYNSLPTIKTHLQQVAEDAK
jgi:phenylalanine-4-hydroxylase